MEFLTILTMTDRMIQRALNYVLTEYYSPSFQENSYGYRENRTSEDALDKVLKLVKSEYNYIVSLDIEKFFDNINHHILMRILKQKIQDKKILVLIERYLKQRIKCGNKIYKKQKGVVQGGPLSPLLANIYLNSFDWEMYASNIRFVRFADDSAPRRRVQVA